MEDNNFIQHQEKLSKSNKTFQTDEKGSKNPFKKAVREYVDSFGNSQNQFNNDVSKAFEETNSTLESFYNKINMLETKLSSVVQQNEALKSRINALQRTDLMIIDSCIQANSDTDKLVNGYIRKVNPELRVNASPTECKEISFQNLSETLKISQGDISVENQLERFSKSYKDAIKKELQTIALNGSNRIIAVVCFNLLKLLNDVSTHSDAVDLYKLLKKSSVYNIKLVSIEPDLEHPMFDGDFLFIPKKSYQDYLNVINAQVYVFCLEDLSIISLEDNLLLKKIIFKLSGENPIESTSSEVLEELIYLNDLGLHKYLVQSDTVSKILVENGFHEPIVSTSEVDTIESFIETPLPKGFTTLKSWKSKGKLLKTTDQLLDYFKQLKESTPLVEPSDKILDFIERQNVDVIIEDRFDNSTNLSLLDVACGNGRITQECVKYGSCTVIDINKNLIDSVSSKFKSSKIETITGDYLTDSVKGQFNVVTCFGYLEHFEYSVRKKVYSNILSNLKDNGLLILNVPNLNFEIPYKSSVNWNTNLYSTSWSKENIIQELKVNGFKVQYIIPIGQGINDKVPDSIKNIPMAWTIGAIKL